MGRNHLANQDSHARSTWNNIVKADHTSPFSTSHVKKGTCNCTQAATNLDNTRVPKPGSPRLDLFLELKDISILFQTFFKILQLLAFLALDLQGYLTAPVKKLCNLLPM